MSIVLGVLAALCGGCGLAALYFGYDLGGTERGVAYTVSGTIAASAGAVMIGLTVLSVRLKQLSRLLGRLLPRNGGPGSAAAATAATGLLPEKVGQHEPEREKSERQDAAIAPPSPEPGAALFEPRPLPGGDLGLDDLLAPEAPKAAPAETAFEAEKARETDRQDENGQQLEARGAEVPAQEPAAGPDIEADVEPALLTRGRDRLGGIFGPPAVAPATPEAEQDPTIPDRGGEPQADSGDAPSEAVAEEAVIEDLPPWHGGAQFTPEPIAAEPAAKHEAPDDEEPVAAPEQSGRKVIGSYTVGANSYTMYGDGSVEALTPNGLYSFGSLEELRSFIEKGGSPATSGR